MKTLTHFTLRRNVCDGLESGHPWVFRDKVGREAAQLHDGEWLRLMDPGGHMIGTGLYQSEGGVAIRVLRLGQRPVTVDWLKSQLDVAIRKRAPLLKETDAYRVVNGESDGFPGIVVDVYGSTAVLQTYAPGVDSLGRYLAGQVVQRLGLASLIWKAPSKRVGGGQHANRLLRGPRPFVVKFHEGELELAADLFAGQKSGTYLDLRGLRRYLAQLDLQGKRVLNLFAYTGMAGVACAEAGAREVINVDQAQASLDFGRRYHKQPQLKWECADVFDWVASLPKGQFDLIVADPPSMASNKGQVPKALQTYHRLYSTLLDKLKPDGTLIACCCTSRISPQEFLEKVSFALRPMSRKLALPMEIDHQPAFSEADYLKVLVFRNDRPERAGRPEKSGAKSGKAEPPRRPPAAKPPSGSRASGGAFRSKGAVSTSGKAAGKGKPPGHGSGKGAGPSGARPARPAAKPRPGAASPNKGKGKGKGKPRGR